MLEVDAGIGRREMAAAKLHFRLQIAFYLLPRGRPGRCTLQIGFYPNWREEWCSWKKKMGCIAQLVRRPQLMRRLTSPRQI